VVKTGTLLDGKYKVIKQLGSGGMGTVYLCKHIRLRNLWAVKKLEKDGSEALNAGTEAEILKGLNHPGIPRLIDMFNHEDNLYLVEDYIEGETLESYIKVKGPVRNEELYGIIFQICSIIEYLHSFEPPIIYRDLKPSNIMLDTKGKVVLIDFGISRIYKPDNKDDTMYMGSRGFAAPEQFGTGQTGKSTDIYGIGAVMYCMLRGRPAENLLEPLKLESYGEGDDTGLISIIQNCMQIDMKKRYGSVEELRIEIEMIRLEHSKKTRLLNSSLFKDNGTGIPRAMVKKESTGYERKNIANKKLSKRSRMVISAITLALTAILLSFLVGSNGTNIYSSTSNKSAKDTAADLPTNLSNTENEKLVSIKPITEKSEEVDKDEDDDIEISDAETSEGNQENLKGANKKKKGKGKGK
jgi:serine/threonine protein kinase